MTTPIRKQIVCPECGRQLSESITIAAEDELPIEEDETEETPVPPIARDDREILVIEEGPICSRCANT